MKILGIVSIVVDIFYSITFAAAIGNSKAEIYQRMVEAGATDSEISLLIGVCIGAFAVSIVFSVTALILVAIFLNKVDKNPEKQRAFHIVMIVLGTMSNAFFIVGGIVGLATMNNTQENQEEKKEASDAGDVFYEDQSISTEQKEKDDIDDPFEE